MIKTSLLAARPLPLRCAAALLAAAAATAFDLVVPHSGGAVPLTPFLLAVLVAAGLGGLVPGLLATALGAAAVLGLPALRPETLPTGLIQLGLFAAGGILASLLGGAAAGEGAAPAAEPRPPQPGETARFQAPGGFAVQARVLENMAEGVSLTDEDGVIVYTNPAEDAMFGAGSGEKIGLPLATWTDDAPEAARAFMAAIAAAIREHGTWCGEWRHRRKDGTPFTTNARISALELSGSKFWVCVQEDITDRKRAEEALREADRRKDEFLAMLAHELRNPLAPIRNAVAVLRAKGHEEPHQKWAREVIDRQVGHMVRLVDDLLDVSRITRGKIDLRRTRVDLAAVVRVAVETSRPTVEAGGHAFAADLPAEPIWLHVDPTRLAQVVANLLNNAAKYTPKGGRIGLAAAVEAGQAVVRVRDTGIGIPPDMLGRVFEIFTQVDASRDRSQGGLGIGLTLVKRLVEMHGGSVEVHSEGAGRGSEFVLRLPLHEPGDARNPDAGRPEAEKASLSAAMPSPCLRSPRGGRQRRRRRHARGPPSALGPRGPRRPRRPGGPRRRGRRPAPRRLPGHRHAGHERLRGRPPPARLTRDAGGGPGGDDRLGAGGRPPPVRRGGVRPPPGQAGRAGGAQGGAADGGGGKPIARVSGRRSTRVPRAVSDAAPSRRVPGHTGTPHPCRFPPRAAARSIRRADWLWR